MLYKIQNVDVLMVECNYVKSVIDSNVKNDSLNLNLRNRIVKNHMSLETLLNALKQADLSNLKKIYILHLSDANSQEKVILEAIQRQTGAIVEIC
jgi:metallo-beta-lactamase domain protein